MSGTELHGVALEFKRVSEVAEEFSKELHQVTEELYIFYEKNSKTLCNSSASLCNSTATPCNSIATPRNSCCNSLWSYQLVEGWVKACFLKIAKEKSYKTLDHKKRMLQVAV